MNKPTYKYFKILAVVDGMQEELFGSYSLEDCEYELEAERDGWKDAGYTRINIFTSTTEVAPDGEVYRNDEIHAL